MKNIRKKDTVKKKTKHEQQQSCKSPKREEKARDPGCWHLSAVSRQRAGAARDRAGRDLRILSCRHQKNNKERSPEGEDLAGTGSFVPRSLGLSRGCGTGCGGLEAMAEEHLKGQCRVNLCPKPRGDRTRSPETRNCPSRHILLPCTSVSPPL